MPRVLITGANRGLGLEFARQYAEEGWEVLACCREPDDAAELGELAATHNIEVERLDVADWGAIDSLARRWREVNIDLLLNNAGLFGPKIQAEGDNRQSFGHVDDKIWGQLLRVNTMAPLRLAEAFVEQIARSAHRKIVSISSVMGSIAQTQTGLYAYRSSKAALNMVMATLANELRPRGIAVAVFCPGWVRTRMGGAGASIESSESIFELRQRIDELDTETPTAFRRYNNEVLPW